MIEKELIELNKNKFMEDETNEKQDSPTNGR